MRSSARQARTPRAFPVAKKNIAQGEILATLCSTGQLAHWSLPGKAWWPAPRIAPATVSTAVWQIAKCNCGYYIATLRATMDVLQGCEITVTFQDHVVNFDYSPNVEITWDGGAKEVDGVRVAGAAAILWGPSDRSGDRNPIAIASVSLPGQQWAPIAESYGLRLAVSLLLECSASPKTARMVGDNLAIVRYAASQGRLKHPSMQMVLDEPLKDLVSSGWETCWFAVRSKVNAAAHACANEALLLAGKLRALGRLAPVFDTSYYSA